MSEYQQSTPNRKARLTEAYQSERMRLCALAAADTPQGAYLQPVFGDGNEHASVVLIGEAPGGEETLQGRPFVGKAGVQLTELLHDMRLDRTSIYITNVVKYRPLVRSERTVRNRTPSKREVEAALPLLQYELSVLWPSWIVTLGNTPLTAVCRLSGRAAETVGVLHGQSLAVSIGDHVSTLFPMYHPASSIYNRTLIDVMTQDASIFGENLVKVGQNCF